MSDDTDLRTFLHLPDGTKYEICSTTKGIRIIRTSGEPPQIEIGGKKYMIESISEFSYLPPAEGPARIVELKEH